MKRLCLTAIVILAATICTDSIAQNCTGLPAPIPLSLMFVDKASSNERTLEFSGKPKAKFEALRTFNGSQDLFVMYSRRAMDDLIALINKGRGIRVYFARYNKCDQSTLPSTVSENKLVLLFATDPKKGFPPSVYYFLNDDIKDTKVYKVEPDCAVTWIDDYNNNVQPELVKNLAASNDNKDPRFPGKFFDTKSILYEKDNVVSGFTTEEAYQLAKHTINITGYKVSFSSYTIDGDQNKRFSNRLLIQFDYIDDKGNPVNLEKQPDFECRLDAALIKYNHFTKAKLKGLTLQQKLALYSQDNGQLCPTNCPEDLP